jgi:hypothetical protein
MKVKGSVCQRQDTARLHSLSVKETPSSLGQCSAQVRGSDNQETRHCSIAPGYLLSFVRYEIQHQVPMTSLSVIMYS